MKAIAVTLEKVRKPKAERKPNAALIRGTKFPRYK
jgi:hypothetical protein